MWSIAQAASPQIQKTDVQVAVHMNPLESLASASWVVQLTLLILIVLSIGAWTIFFQKSRQLRKVRAANEEFLEEFWKGASFEAIYERLLNHPDSSLARVFRQGYMELKKMADSPLLSGSQEAPSLGGFDNLERALRKSVDLEVQSMEFRLGWLATTGSTGPFIGLFGTVWGIMGAFQKIGQAGAASLAVVAPGISEALVATAIGLAAAIPAVMIYNYFVNNIRRMEIDLTNFSADFLNMTRRNFFRS